MTADNADVFKTDVAFKGMIPAEPLRGRGSFAVLLEPAAKGAIVCACVGGVCPARLDVHNEGHDFADAAPGDCAALHSTDAGAAQVLWREPGSGRKWAYVRLGNRNTEFWARIEGAYVVGSNQWSYLFTEVHKTGTGYGSWQSLPFGRAGVAYNGVEDPNDGEGLEGNGVNLDDLADPIYWPAGLGIIVRMRELRIKDDNVEYWFQFENAVTCCPSSM